MTILWQSYVQEKRSGGGNGCRHYWKFQLQLKTINEDWREREHRTKLSITPQGTFSFFRGRHFVGSHDVNQASLYSV
ncbi:hypothetical protein PRUPE_5G173900 [Prunus persica]|uniref:Uncharacterized protein n=1 Tax=Prunus persica TaxID=3760 RepID=M5WCI9_PRUPE|nr:hypothetical protein PRUPE_5G173900 [Prunus persica]